MKPLRLSSEFVYLLSLALLALAVSLTAAADFGVSMIVAPAYILSLKCPALTFGQAEYIVQGVLFVVFCVAMRRVRPLYLVSFATGLLYGVMLDAWRLIPALSPAAVGTAPMPVRVALLLVGMVLTSFSIALIFRIYLYPHCVLVFSLFHLIEVEVDFFDTEMLRQKGRELCGISFTKRYDTVIHCGRNY